MKTRTLKQLLLYNYRYVFAYAIIFGFIAYFLGWQLSTIGPGLSAAEIESAARHLTSTSILNLPIYPLHSLLQWASISLLGVSVLAIRIPSVIIALLVALSLYHLLKRWFGKSTALLSTAIFISADWFLFIARLGGGGIEFSLWLALGLLSFTKLIEHKTKWLLLFALVISTLLFVPFGIYAAITLVACLFSSKVFRERIGEAHIAIKIPAVCLMLLGLGLSIFASINNHEFLKNILGIQTLPTITLYLKSLFINTSAVAVVLPNANPAISPSGMFFVRFFELIFIAFGVIMLWKTRVNRLNLTVLILSVVLVIVSGLSSGSRGGGLILVPAAIFMTAGIRHLLHRWQRTFPKNPYARVAASAPLGVLFICVVALHYFIYFQLWPSQSATHTVFTSDLGLVQNELNRETYTSKTCFVDTPDSALQDLITASNTVCRPVFSASDKNSASVYILRPSTDFRLFTSKDERRALVSVSKADNVRWIVVSK